MATITFFIFMSVGYLFTKRDIPESKTQVWIYSITVPLVLLVIAVLIASGGDPYLIGLYAPQCAISTIATMILMYVRFDKIYKLNKDE